MASDSSHEADELWRRVGQADSLQSLLAIVEAAGYHPVLLARRSLLRDDCDLQEISTVLGQLGAFGCLADKETIEGHVLSRRELQLVQLGVRKRSINRLVRGLQHARNVSKAVCLVVDCRPPAPDAVARPLVEARHHAFCDVGATVLFGVGASTVARVDARLPADPVASDASSSSSDCESEASASASADADAALVAAILQRQRRKCCDFADVTLVAYQPAVSVR